MTILQDYNEFSGRNWETGPVRNYLAYRGFHNPSTGKPFSEALMMGVSGGAVFGYFTFAYEGYDPMCRLLTRNTFNPLETMLSRLGVEQEIRQTANPDRAMANLLDTLASGTPALAWVDSYSLPYNRKPHDDGMWMGLPVLVFGVDEDAGQVRIADRSKRPLAVPIEAFHQARARIKKDKFRLVTLGPPNPAKLVPAVQAGIWDCIKLFTEAPPKGTKNNFGLQAYRFWIENLTQPRARLRWARVFPPGVEMFAGLVGAYDSIQFFNGYDRAERALFADFLDEAAGLLQRPQLGAAAEKFREAAACWADLGLALLPDSIAPFAEMRQAMHQAHDSFIEQGDEAGEELAALKARQRAIRDSMVDAFPLTEGDAALLLERVAAGVQAVHDVEQEAVSTLRAAMG